MIKIRNVVYDEKPFQQAVSQKTTIWVSMKGGTSVLEYLNFFNKVIRELLVVDVKIDEEDKALILLSSLIESYDHFVATMLYGKETLIFEEVTSTLLSNEIRKRPNQEEQTGSSLVVTRKKEEEKEENVQAHQKRVTFVTGKIIGRMTVSIDKSGGRRRGKLRRQT